VAFRETAESPTPRNADILQKIAEALMSQELSPAERRLELLIYLGMCFKT
jgi:hypothetical protein